MNKRSYLIYTMCFAILFSVYLQSRWLRGEQQQKSEILQEQLIFKHAYDVIQLSHLYSVQSRTPLERLYDYRIQEQDFKVVGLRGDNRSEEYKRCPVVEEECFLLFYNGLGKSLLPEIDLLNDAQFKVIIVKKNPMPASFIPEHYALFLYRKVGDQFLFKNSILYILESQTNSSIDRNLASLPISERGQALDLQKTNPLSFSADLCFGQAIKVFPDNELLIRNLCHGNRNPNMVNCFIQAQDQYKLSEQESLTICRKSLNTLGLECLSKLQSRFPKNRKELIEVCQFSQNIHPAQCFVTVTEKVKSLQFIKEIVSLCEKALDSSEVNCFINIMAQEKSNPELALFLCQNKSSM